MGIVGWKENERGVSVTFGPDVVTDFCDTYEYDLVVRSHQVVDPGFEFFSSRQLVTLFSAPNHDGEYENEGAVMTVDDKHCISFQLITNVAKAPGPPVKT